jgi:uncharacterized membrane protein YbaN (DUF454 family)
MTTPRLTSGPARLAWLTAGWTAVGFGTAGVFVPGLPTTVFLLTAFYCFTRSSPAFARWLCEHPRLGAPLRRYLEDGGLSASGKTAALLAMWTSVLASSVVLLSVRPMASAITLGLGALGTIAIRWGVPTIRTPAHGASGGVR